MRSMTGAGVPLGASRANQVVDISLGAPSSAMVGTSGRAGERCGAITPMARTRPALTCAAMPGMSWNISCSSPLMRLVVALPGLEKGTCTICAPYSRE